MVYIYINTHFSHFVCCHAQSKKLLKSVDALAALAKEAAELARAAQIKVTYTYTQAIPMCNNNNALMSYCSHIIILLFAYSNALIQKCCLSDTRVFFQARAAEIASGIQRPVVKVMAAPGRELFVCHHFIIYVCV